MSAQWFWYSQAVQRARTEVASGRSSSETVARIRRGAPVAESVASCVAPRVGDPADRAATCAGMVLAYAAVLGVAYHPGTVPRRSSTPWCAITSKRCGPPSPATATSCRRSSSANSARFWVAACSRGASPACDAGRSLSNGSCRLLQGPWVLSELRQAADDRPGGASGRCGAAAGRRSPVGAERPYRLRYLLALNHRLCRSVLRVYVRALLAFHRSRARRAGARWTGRGGDGDPALRRGCQPPRPFPHDGARRGLLRRRRRDDIAALLAASGAKRCGGRAGASDGPCPGGRCSAAADSIPPTTRRRTDPLAEESPVLAGLASAAVQGRVALGPHAGRRSCGWGAIPSALGDLPLPTPGGARRLDLHADVAVPASDRARLESLCRYVLRPPLAQERLRLIGRGPSAGSRSRPAGTTGRRPAFRADRVSRQACRARPARASIWSSTTGCWPPIIDGGQGWWPTGCPPDGAAGNIAAEETVTSCGAAAATGAGPNSCGGRSRSTCSRVRSAADAWNSSRRSTTRPWSGRSSATSAWRAGVPEARPAPPAARRGSAVRVNRPVPFRPLTMRPPLQCAHEDSGLHFEREIRLDSRIIRAVASYCGRGTG